MSAYPYDLGAYTKPITTTSSDAQIWFDRGLNWVYGYHHEEAGMCFQKALDRNPTMRHGALGPSLYQWPKLQ